MAYEELKEALRSQLEGMDVQKVYFYVSDEEARGGGESPFLAVVIRETDRPFEERIFDLLDVLQHLPEPVEFLIYTPQEWDELLNEGSDLAQKVRDHGEVILGG